MSVPARELGLVDPEPLREEEHRRSTSVEEYYRAVAPWLDRALEAREDLDWWKGVLARLDPELVVELGCGTGRVTVELARPGRTVVGLDLSADMLELAAEKVGRERGGTRSGVALLRADFSSLPLGDGVGLVVAPNDPTLHLVRDERRQRVLDEIARVLAPDGRLVLELLWWTPDQRKAARSEGRLWERRLVELADGGSLEIEESWTLDEAGPGLTGRYRYRLPDGSGVTAAFRGRRWTLDEVRVRLDRAGLEPVSLTGGWDGRPFDPDDADVLLVEAAPAERESNTERSTP